MSIARQCDRCGEFYKSKKMNVGDVEFKLGMGVKRNNNTFAVRTWDLCDRCQTELTMFAMGVPNIEDADDFVYKIEIK